jgi:hypothetical protein
MMKRLIVFILISICLAIPSIAQRKAMLEIDSAQIRIGEQVKATLKIEIEEGEQVKFPFINKFLTDQLEVVELSEVDTQDINNVKILRQTLSITSFDSGSQTIPSFEFVLKKNNSFDTIYSNLALVRVNLMEVDTLKPIKDIKPPLDTPFQRSELWAYLNYLLYLVIFIVAGLILWQYLRLNKPKPKPISAPSLVVEEPADLVALKELEELNKKKDWKTIEGIKDFHEEISIIIRRYIQNRFKVQALEKTSGEVLTDIRKEEIDKDLYKGLNQLLVLSDYVKFAKYKPSAEENELSLKNSFAFVNRTKSEKMKTKVDA